METIIPIITVILLLASLGFTIAALYLNKKRQKLSRFLNKYVALLHTYDSEKNVAECKNDLRVIQELKRELKSHSKLFADRWKKSQSLDRMEIHIKKSMEAL